MQNNTSNIIIYCYSIKKNVIAKRSNSVSQVGCINSGSCQPQNFNNVALSGTGQYQLASVTGGALYQSLNYGIDWTVSTIAPDIGLIISPNLTGIAASTWTNGGVSWTASASSEYPNLYAYGAFNNYYRSNGSPYSWASSSAIYNGSSYTGTIVTSITGVGFVKGEWLQLQSSVPIIMNSYTFTCGGAVVNLPQIYYIIGSNDNASWYPIQYANIVSNPLNATFTACSSYLLANYKGIQTLTGATTTNVTTMSYPYSTMPFTYFRIVINNVFASGSAAEIGEWYINFTTRSTTSGRWSGLAISNTGQYMIGIGGSCITPQLSTLSTNTWTVNGVAWIASASSNNSGFLAYGAFNSMCAQFGNYSYTSLQNYSATGVYNNTYSMTVLGGVGVIKGEWLQLQSSVPLVINSYTFGTGINALNLMKTYYIVGSNDETNWYPLQYGAFATNPLANFSACYTYILMNYTGTQSVTGTSTVSITTTSYSTSTVAYTYFRIINTGGFNPCGGYFELGEWFINFVGGQIYSTNYGTTWTNDFTSPAIGALALSGNGHYTLATTGQTAYIQSNYVAPLYSNIANTIGPNDVNTIATGATALGTIAYYSLSDAAESFASGAIEIIAGNTANVTGTVTFNTPGQMGTCANFSGNGYLTCASGLNSVWNNLTTGSISCWVYPTATSSLTGSVLCIKTQVNTSSYAFLTIGGYNPTNTLVTGTSGKVYFGMSNGAANACMSSACCSRTVLALNTWCHIAVTFNGSVVQFYINGKLDNIFYDSWTLASNAAGIVYIGAAGANSFGYFTGNIDEFALWNIAIPQSTVTVLYSSISPMLTNINAALVATALSYTGQYQVMVTSGTTYNFFYSINYGATFTGITVGSAASLVSCAISSDGSYITVASATTIYTLNNNSSGYSLAIGNNAGNTNQGTNAIAIGSYAGYMNQLGNSIILNATGTTLNAPMAGLYVAPILPAAATFQLLGYGGDNQVVTISAAANSPTVQRFISGSGIYTPSGGTVRIRIRMCGAGGGGSGASGSNGVIGGNTMFGLWTTIGGGPGIWSGQGGVGGSNGANGIGNLIVRFTGGSGAAYLNVSYVTGTTGGANPFGGAGVGGDITAGISYGGGMNACANTGAGGGGATGGAGIGGAAGGGAGEYVEFYVTYPCATSYIIGMGGIGAIGGAGTFNGGCGASGIIIIEEMYT